MPDNVFETPDTGCAVTILTSAGPRLSKTICRDAVGDLLVFDYEKAKNFRAFGFAIDGIEQLGNLLITLAAKPQWALVRGKLTDSALAELAQGLSVPRLLQASADHAPTIEDTPRRWLMFDKDDFHLDDITELNAWPDAVVERIIEETLPHEFHSASCFWQFSSTCGFRPGVAKCHIWYWLAEPVSCAVLKYWVETLGLAVDQSVFSPAQIHYTAAPLLQGVTDPLLRRHGWLYGAEDAVTLPPIEMPPAPVYSRPVGDYQPSGGSIIDALLQVGDGPGRGGFHAPLRRAAMIYARKCRNDGARDDAGMLSMMTSAARRAPCRDERGAARASPAHLRDLIASAHARVALS